MYCIDVSGCKCEEGVRKSKRVISQKHCIRVSSQVKSSELKDTIPLRTIRILGNNCYPSISETQTYLSIKRYDIKLPCLYTIPSTL